MKVERVYPIKNLIPLSLAIVLLCTNGCSAPKEGKNPETAPNATNKVIGQSATLTDDDTRVQFAEEAIPPIAVNLPSLGSTAFTVDASNSATGKFLGNGRDLVLQLTDRAGLTWTLEIPSLAIGSPQTITMTSLAGLSSSEIPGSLLGGIALEPDGLEFDTPATLTVSGEALKGTTLLFSGAQDGTRMEFTMPAEASESAGARILHFSSVVADDLEDPEVDQLRKEAQKQYKELAAQAREVIRNKDIAVPHPPSYPLECTNEEQTKANEELLLGFAKQFGNPENVLLEKMLAVQTQLQLMGAAPDYTLEQGLLARLVSKANLLMKEYGQDEEKIPAIAYVTMKVATAVQLLGDDPTGSSTSLMEAVAAMYEKAIETLFDKLIAEHNYKVIKSILEAARAVQFLSSGTKIDSEKILKRIENALHFDMEITYTQHLGGIMHWVVKAGFPVKADNGSASTYTLAGSGTGSLLSFTNDTDSQTGIAPDFNVQVAIEEFMPCEGTAKLKTGQFYPPPETYTDEAGSASAPLLQLGWEQNFIDFQMEGNFVFPITIQNNNIEAVHQTIEASSGECEGILDIILTHTPQN